MEVTTRPDISFIVSVESQFMYSPNKEHMRAIFRILQYLKQTPSKGLMFKKRDNVYVDAYTHANWASSIDDRISTFEYCTFVGGNLVTSRN